MESIDLFADSFGDQKVLPQPHRTWVDLLSDHYEIKNFSLSGTGAHYHVQKLMDLQEYSDYLLFMMPDINRLNLDYIEEKDQATSNIVFKQKESNKFDPNFWMFNELIVGVSDKIFRDYVGFYNAQIHKILEPLIVQFVFSKSQIYKKILVWCSSGGGYPFLYNNNLTIPENCHIVRGSLNIISDNEPENFHKFSVNEDTGEVEHDHKPVVDTRNNHLCESNHKFLVKSINNYLKRGTSPDVSMVLEGFEYKTGPPGHQQDFIYE